eukprot:CAMPEP_0182422974 /NCGR_PEP_ID=MMETSP1167-20130531/8847_1 /TAXON_ID=2988 /ORGANISM="Mallomonas Sp, Strain CCMP3275" /LENGTH=234 /DNA_ID=CAMNT_0024601515 /DNA_START=117 /DNA_END=822 /DNA_ORIENTATION=+
MTDINKDFWRSGALKFPDIDRPIVLYSIESRHQFAMMRSGGDATAVGKLWSPTKFLSLFLLHVHRLKVPLLDIDWIRGQIVIEIGAGWSGAAGLAAYRLGARSVVVTDGERVMVDCLHVNAQMEILSSHSSSSPSHPKCDVSCTRAFDDIHRGEEVSDQAHKVSLPGLNDENKTSTIHPSLTGRLLRWGNINDANEILTELHTSSVDTILGCDTLYTDPEVFFKRFMTIYTVEE